MIKNVIIYFLAFIVLILSYLIVVNGRYEKELFSLKNDGFLNLTNYSYGSETLNVGVEGDSTFQEEIRKDEYKRFDQMIYVANNSTNYDISQNGNGIIFGLTYDKNLILESSSKLDLTKPVQVEAFIFIGGKKKDHIFLNSLKKYNSSSPWLDDRK